ncbi:MAG: hypothetical protein EXR09_06735 [Acetobacteraceae bacterium]|nr:hypothetical protein [Acetobacteraceae bacterium]
MSTGAACSDTAPGDRVRGDSAAEYAILELDPTASAAEVTVAYRRMAKRLHPDPRLCWRGIISLPQRRVRRSYGGGCRSSAVVSEPGSWKRFCRCLAAAGECGWAYGDFYRRGCVGFC